jgi:hypothetical protein
MSPWQTPSVNTDELRDKAGRSDYRWNEDENSPVSLVNGGDTQFTFTTAWDEVLIHIPHWQLAGGGRSELGLRVRFEGDASFFSGSGAYASVRFNGGTSATEFVLFSRNNAGARISGTLRLNLSSTAGKNYPLAAPEPITASDGGSGLAGGGVVATGNGRIAELQFGGLKTNADQSPTDDGVVEVYGKNYQ